MNSNYHTLILVYHVCIHDCFKCYPSKLGYKWVFLFCKPMCVWLGVFECACFFANSLFHCRYLSNDIANMTNKLQKMIKRQFACTFILICYANDVWRLRFLCKFFYFFCECFRKWAQRLSISYFSFKHNSYFCNTYLNAIMNSYKLIRL